MKKVTAFILILIITGKFIYPQDSPVEYKDLYSSESLKNRNLDYSLPVGTTPGLASVTLSGGTSYSVPIALPPGTNGLAPGLAVSYNSQGGNGILGMGWNISGLSVIHRMALDWYHDGIAGPATLAGDPDNGIPNGPFALDGNRLISPDHINGEDGAVYYTENETFSRIVSHGKLGNGPEYFEVKSKSGLTNYYGGTTDSRMLEEGKAGNILFWRLNKMVDLHGNYIEYKYKLIGRELLIDEIHFTGNSPMGLVPYNKVKFYYASRLDANKGFIEGSSLDSEQLLTKIRITGEGGTLFKEYTFCYGYDNLYSFLTELTEWGSDGTHLNSTKFKYGDQSEEFYSTETNIIDEAFYNEFIGDFNGDGYSDIIRARFTHVNGITHHSYFEYFEKIPNSDFFTLITTKTLPSSTSYVNDIDIPNTVRISSFDFDGDGKDELLVEDQIYDGTYWRLNEILLYSLDATGTTFSSTSYSTDPSVNIIHPTAHNYLYVGDFDGDGTNDYLTNFSDGSGYQAFLSFPFSGSLNKEVTGPLSSPNQVTSADQIYVIDYDGDGKTELMLISPHVSGQNDCKIYSFEKNANGEYESIIVHAAGYPTEYHHVSTGDFNGDGKTDLLTGPESGIGNTWEISLSKGLGNDFESFPFSFNPLPDLNVNVNTTEDMIRILDINGDGKSDIVHGEGDNYQIYNKRNVNLHIYYSNGLGFEYVKVITGDMTSYHWTLLPGDFNGDGGVDFFFGHPQDPDKLYFFRKEDKSRLLKTMSDGYNRVAEFDYRRMTVEGNFYKKGSGASFPVNDIQAPGWIASSWTQPDGIGGTYSTSFTYIGARLHRQGRGFLGFQKVESNSSLSGVKTINETEINTDFYISVPIGSESYKLSDNSLVSESEPTSTVVNLGYNRFWLRTDQVVVTDHDRNRTITKIWSYDSYGNVLTDHNNINGLEYSTVTHSYGMHGTWIPAHPIETTTLKVRGGNAPSMYNHVTTRTFNAQGAMVEQKNFAGQAKELTTAFTYNGFGNLLSEATSASGLASKINAYTYDSKGRFPLSVNPGMGLIETRTYDFKWGLPLTILTADGLSSSFQYDGYGRSIQTITPEGNTIQTSLHWDTQQANLELYYRKTDIPGKPLTVIYYDIFDRETKKKVSGFGSYWLRTLTTYDAKGNVKTTTSPHKEFDPYETTTYFFDDFYSRPCSISNSIGVTTYSYAHHSNGELSITIIDPAGRTVTEIKDATDRTISQTDDGGTLNYDIDCWGNVSKLALGGIDLATMQYDVYGHQTHLIDKNAGTTTYEYNPYGELVMQTDSKGQVQQMQYDALGRQTYHIAPEGTTSFAYVTSGNGKGRLDVMLTTNASGISKNYDYDSLSRVSSLTENIDGSNFTKSYTYNTYGDLKTVTYPSGFGIQRIYNSEGYLTKVKNDAGTVTLFDAGSGDMNAFGQFTQFTLGNGKQTTKTYNSFGIPVNYSTTGIQDLAMNFDLQTGNLISRMDNLIGRSEVFTYDDLNRLTSSQVFGPSSSLPRYNYSYSANGNIATKPDAGTYTYSLQKIHAITAVTNPQSIISSIQQDVSYNSNQDPIIISEGVNEMEFSYSPDRSRKKSERNQNGILKERRYYLGSYEINIDYNAVHPVSEVHYITGGDGLCAMVVRNNNQDTYYYVYTDHLGSILTVTNDQGVVVEEQNFDAWGRARNPNDWTYNNITATSSWLYRGYTGHEHLKEFGIIHMNGRLYDPIMGRMLSPDNHVQGGLGTQGYNRYSYAGNNPLRYTDPSGEVVPLVIAGAAIIGGAINLASNWNNIDNVWEGLAAFGAGAVSGVLTSVYGPAGALAGGAITGATNALIGQIDGRNGFNDVNWAQVGLQTGIGAVAGIAGWGAGTWASQNIGGAIVNGIHLSSQSGLGGLVSGAIGGAGGGFVGGFAGGLLATGNLDAGLQAGFQGAIMGAGIGAGTGFAAGFASASRGGRNPWTGRPKNSAVIGGPQSRVKTIAKNTGTQSLSDNKIQNWPEDLPGYLGKDMPNPVALEFNRTWMEVTIEAKYHFYDAGRPNGYSPFYHGVELPALQQHNYPNVYKAVYFEKIYFNKTFTILKLYN